MRHTVFPKGAWIDEEGVWVQALRRPEESTRRAGLFLDRDGVVVDEVGHLCRVEDVRLVPGSADVIAAANGLGVPVVMVSNQSGIGRGLFGWDAFVDVQFRILEELAEDGAFVDAVLACPHHPEGKPPYDDPNHPCRKPSPGMILKAAHALPLDLAGSWIIGDRALDIAAGRNAGLAGGLHVSTGCGRQPGERDAALALAIKGVFRVLVGPSIGAALTILPLFRNALAE